MNAQTGERTELADSSADMYGYEFAGTADNYLYYSSSDTARGELVLYQINLENPTDIQEADRFALPQDLIDVPGNVLLRS